MNTTLYWPNAITDDGRQLFTYEAALTLEKALYQFFIWEDMGYKIKSAYIQGPGNNHLDLKRTTNPWVINAEATNADRIRAMTDEELAEWLNRKEINARYFGLTGKDEWISWLQSFAEGTF